MMMSQSQPPVSASLRLRPLPQEPPLLLLLCSAEPEPTEPAVGSCSVCCSIAGAAAWRSHQAAQRSHKDHSCRTTSGQHVRALDASAASLASRPLRHRRPATARQFSPPQL